MNFSRMIAALHGWMRQVAIWFEVHYSFLTGMEPGKEAEMGNLQKLRQSELATALQLKESEVARFISDNDPKPDGSGHWVFFSLETPKEILERLRVGKDLRLDLKAS